MPDNDFGIKFKVCKKLKKIFFLTLCLVFIIHNCFPTGKSIVETNIYSYRQLIYLLGNQNKTFTSVIVFISQLICNNK